MTTNQSTAPAHDELEVSVFGPGYGEAILFHMGAGQWILVDSCLDPASRQPASLQYLQDLSVNVEEAVKLIIATHWHDDHVRGISTVFSKCQSARLIISDALKNEEFLTLASLYHEPSTMRSSGLDEFIRVFQLLEARRSPSARFNSPQWAIADRVLYRDNITLPSGAVEINVSALSPSDSSLQQARLAFAELLREQERRRRRVASLEPNHTSVVLWIEVGNHRILLGADLEETGDQRTGWSVILSDTTVVSGKASVFKIPHHGSENAHHPGVWSDLLTRKPFAIVTPFSRGQQLLLSSPDVKRIADLTPHAYITAPARCRRQKYRNRVVRDFVKEATASIYRVHHGWGQVRLRQKLSKPTNFWQVELFGDAYALEA